MHYSSPASMRQNQKIIMAKQVNYPPDEHIKYQSRTFKC